jgi:predicted enzyme related to lactoylglutathione lyase
MPSPLVFFNIASPDPEGARAFYAALFDWTFGEAGAAQGGGVAIDPGGPGDFDPQGTLQALPAGSAPRVTPWFRVTDLWATVAKAEELGARVLVPIRQTAPGGAHIALVRAPDGQAVGIVQA